MSLYEFSLQRTYEDGTVKTTAFQVPAENDTEALINLGRSHPHKDEKDFHLKVLSFNRVGIAEAVLARNALVDKIMSHQFSEPDCDSMNGGMCESFHEVKDMFSSYLEAKYLINKVLDARDAVSS